VHIPGPGNKMIALLARLIPEQWALGLMNRNSAKIRKGSK